MSSSRNDKAFEALCRYLQNNHPGQKPEENILLFGAVTTLEQQELRECVVGELLAITPGLVMFLPQADYSQGFAGQLVRQSCSSFLFILEPLVKSGDPRTECKLSINLLPQGTVYAAEITCSQGYNWTGSQTLGIEPGRWAYMERWLNKWLPELTESPVA